MCVHNNSYSATVLLFGSILKQCMCNDAVGHNLAYDEHTD